MAETSDLGLGRPGRPHLPLRRNALTKFDLHAPRRSTPGVVWGWLVPMAVVVMLATLITTVFYVLDILLVEGRVTSAIGVVEHYLAFTPELIADALPALGAIIVAALGIVLTVIAIIVQLSSERYTGVAMMFLRDPVHIAVLSYYVVASLCAVWLSVGLRMDFVPLSLMMLVMILTSVGLATMLPYFAYTFWFLEPGNIILRLRMLAARTSRLGIAASSPSEAGPLQARLVRKMEEITDIANNSIEGQDKIIAGHAVDALRDLLVDYILSKPPLYRPWYRIGEELRANPDFVGMDKNLQAELETRGLWVEWKILHEYMGVYHQALGSMEDVNSLLAIDTRHLGEVAAATGQTDFVQMVLRFMNSFLRTAIDWHHPRTCCDVLLQYRMLLEELLRNGDTDAAVEGVGFLHEIGQIASEQGLSAVTETVAYDMATLCRHARQNHLGGEERIVRLLLDLDPPDPVDTYQEQRGLRGIRVAQTILAVFYLSIGDESKARMIADDMRGMSASMRDAVRNDVGSAAPPHAWEVVDRGRNLHFLTESERVQVNVFFSMLSDSEVGAD